MKERVSVMAAFKYGIQATWQHFWFLLGIYLFSLTVFLAVFLPGFSFNAAFFTFLLSATQDSVEAVRALFIEHLFKSWVTFGSIFLSIILMKVVFDILRLGTFRVLLDLHDKGESSIKRLFSCAGIFYRYTFASLLSGAIILAGLVCLIIPGVIFALRFSFFPYLLADKKVGVIESLKLSWERTRGHMWALFFLALLFGAVMGLLRIISLILSNTVLALGQPGMWFMWLVEVSATTYAVFIIGFAWVYIYRRLNKKISITDEIL